MVGVLTVELSADKPRIMASSTSFFLVSMAARREDRSTEAVPSSESLALLDSSNFSRPAMSSFLALMLSLTAPSALARFFKSDDRRAAYTGGLGRGVFGSVNFVNSVFAVSSRGREVDSRRDRADCGFSRGWSSGGRVGVEKREPPRRAPPERAVRDLSTSVCDVSYCSGSKNDGWYTLQTLLGGILDGEFEDVSLTPNLNNALDLLASLLCCALVSQGCGFCDDLYIPVRINYRVSEVRRAYWAEGEEKVVLLARL